MNRKNILYILFILIFTLAAIEIFGRVYLSAVLKKSPNPKFRFNSYRIYEHVPGFKEGEGKTFRMVINSQGFRRAADVVKRKPGNTYRIFLLGGSAAHGISSATPYPIVNINMNETIDAYLEQKLKAENPGKNIEVINAAVTGYQCFQHTAYLLSELLDYNPDMVLFFDGANDHYFYNPDYDYYLENKYQFWAPRLKNPSLKGMFNYGMLWLSKYSGFARGYLAWKLSRDAAARGAKFPTYTNHSSADKIVESHKSIAPKQYLRSIETNINILLANNIKCVIGLQPMLVLRDKEFLSKEEKAFLHEDQSVDALYPIVVNELKALTEKYRIPFVDFNPSLNDERYKNKQLLIDYCHLNPLGGEMIAQQYLSVVDSLMKN